MKKMSKLSVMCIILLAIVLMLTNISFAEENIIDFDALLNTEEIEEESESDDQNSDPSENSNTGDNTTENSVSEDEATEDNSKNKTNNSSQGDNTKTTTVNTVTDDSKLPQTGEKENITVIASVAVFGILAVVAYKNIKKYNVK